MKKTALFFIYLVLLSLNLYSYPGYVSRDCGVVGTKESITVDWEQNRYFYTISYHKIVQNNQTVVQRVNSVENCATKDVCYQWLWRSRAGKMAVANTVTQLGVTGYHYWWDHNTKKESMRTSYNTTCNIDHWGGGNWDIGQL